MPNRIYIYTNENIKFIIKKNYERIGCVFTGDSDLNKIDISKIYSKFKHSIGTVQIPHHGELDSFDQNQFLNTNYRCPISFGTKNNFGHPSLQVINHLKNNGNIPICVDDQNKYIELILT